MTSEAIPDTPAGVYPRGGNQTDLSFWNGSEWDPRGIASVGTRVWVFLIDLVVVSLIWVVLVVIVAIPAAGQEGESLSDALGIFIVFLAPALAFIGYFTIFYATSGASVGMLMGGLSVIDVSSGAQRLSWGKAFLRAFVLLVGLYFFVTAIIWLAVTAGSKTRQGPHDLAAKTIVLRKVKVQQTAPRPVVSAASTQAEDRGPTWSSTEEAQDVTSTSMTRLPTSTPDVSRSVDPFDQEVAPGASSDEEAGPANKELMDPVSTTQEEPRRDDQRPVIFISHATEDAETAMTLCGELESQGLRTWLASRDVGIGTNYAAEIVRAVNSAQYLLVILSPASIESPHVRREVSIAIDRHVPVLPVSTDPTGAFMANLPVDWTYWLSLAQVFRMSDASSTAAEIARRIR